MYTAPASPLQTLGGWHITAVVAQLLSVQISSACIESTPMMISTAIILCRPVSKQQLKCMRMCRDGDLEVLPLSRPPPRPPPGGTRGARFHFAFGPLPSPIQLLQPAPAVLITQPTGAHQRQTPLPAHASALISCAIFLPHDVIAVGSRQHKYGIAPGTSGPALGHPQQG